MRPRMVVRIGGTLGIRATKEAGMRWERMLMQPFSPGRYKDRDGKNRFVSDEAWRRAFPDCKFNKWLDGVTPAPDPVVAKIKDVIDRRQTGEASCC